MFGKKAAKSVETGLERIKPLSDFIDKDSENVKLLAQIIFATERTNDDAAAESRAVMAVRDELPASKQSVSDEKIISTVKEMFSE